MIDSKEVGTNSSSTWSPYLECGVCIARIDKNDVKEGDRIVVQNIDGEKIKAEISFLPMYDKDGLILRGVDQSIPSNSNPWFKE